MNLFLNPSENELYSLLRTTPESPVHDVVVDYDGEVLIDPQLSHPGVDLKKFKFHTRLSELSRQAISAGSRQLQHLLHSLQKAWEGDRPLSLS